MRIGEVDGLEYLIIRKIENRKVFWKFGFFKVCEFEIWNCKVGHLEIARFKILKTWRLESLNIAKHENVEVIESYGTLRFDGLKMINFEVWRFENLIRVKSFRLKSIARLFFFVILLQVEIFTLFPTSFSYYFTQSLDFIALAWKV